MVVSSPPPEVAAGRWERLLTWAIREGRVVVRREGRAVRFAPATMADLPLAAAAAVGSEPARRDFGAHALERAAAAERALQLACNRYGRHVTGREIADVWREANGADVPPDVAGRIGRALEPSVSAGRVRATAGARYVMYAPAFQPASERVAEQVSERVSDCAESNAAEADARSASAAWPVDHPDVVPAPGSGEAHDGGNDPHGTAARGGGGEQRQWPSDLTRVEEAARRAVTRHDSAVRLEMIADEVDRDPVLALQGRTPRGVLVQRLLHTRRLTRVHPRFVPMDLPKRTVYYSVPNGPTRLRGAMLSTPDRRLAALHQCWRTTGGRPVSTAALRRYAEARETFRIPDDPSYGWTNALQVFEQAGAVVRLPVEEDERYVLWAPAAAWKALSDQERTARIRDAFGRAQRGWGSEVEDVLGVGVTSDDGSVDGDDDVANDFEDARAGYLAGLGRTDASALGGALGAGAGGSGDDRCVERGDGAEAQGTWAGEAKMQRAAPPDLPAAQAHGAARRGTGVEMDAPPHDVRFFSRNRDLRALVALAKQMRAAEGGGDEQVRRVVAERPVTARDVERAAASHAHLAPRGIRIARALHEASRVRVDQGMRRSSVVRVGVVKDVTYYDLPSVPSAAEWPNERAVARTESSDSDAAQTGQSSAASPAAGDSALAARAYVVHLQAMADAAPEWLERDLALLREAQAQDTTGLVPLGAVILHARAAHIEHEATARAAQIATAAAATRLLPDEAQDAESMRGRLLDVAAGARTVERAMGPTVCPEGQEGDGGDVQTPQYALTGCPGDAPSWETVVLDMRTAATQLKRLVAYRMDSERQLGARLIHSVAAIRVPSAVVCTWHRHGDAMPVDVPDGDWAEVAHGTPNEVHEQTTSARAEATAGSPHECGGAAARLGTSGRPVSIYLDRVGFACHLTPRFALGALGPFVATAQQALGALRDPRPFIATLQDASRKAAHTPALAALGMLDDPAARTAAAAYLRAGCVPGGATAGGPASGRALPTAVLALAPKPLGGLATTLHPEERGALVDAAALPDEYTAALADAVLRAWDERWDIERLLRL